MGDVKDGGENVYYKDEKNSGEAIKIVSYCNENIQIDCYNKILHAQLPYEGKRCSMILNLKEPIVNYFINMVVMHTNNANRWVIQINSVHIKTSMQ